MAKLTEKQVDIRVAKIKDLEAQITELGEKKDALIKEIKDYMNEEDLLVIETKKFKVTWSKGNRTQFDTPKFKKEMPELYKKFSYLKDNRVFRTSKLG